LGYLYYIAGKSAPQKLEYRPVSFGNNLEKTTAHPELPKNLDRFKRDISRDRRQEEDRAYRRDENHADQGPRSNRRAPWIACMSLDQTDILHVRSPEEVADPAGDRNDRNPVVDEDIQAHAQKRRNGNAEKYRARDDVTREKRRRE